MGARTTVSTCLPPVSTLPPSCNASRSCAGEGLVHQGATDHRHRLGTVGLLAAELSGGGHGPQTEHGEYGDDDSAALHLRAAPSRRIGWDALTRQYVARRRLFPAWNGHRA